MERKPAGRRKGTDAKIQDRRVAVIVLKDTPAYRDWVVSLTEATLIPTATIVRDALSKWAADRGLPAPPSGPSRRGRR
jgi:hypothetical protein